MEELDRVAPGAPLLALGQTVFWDEPMKGGIVQAARRMGFQRRLVAGIHDTDYFAKLASGPRAPGKFRAMPHNDGSTRGLWSAAGEFSALFGSETVVTRDQLSASGLRLDRLSKDRPGFLDQATEAWGWKGVVSLDEHAPITAQVPLRQIFSELQSTFDWALNLSLECLSSSSREVAQGVVDQLRTTLCDAAEPRTQTVSEFYQRLLPSMYAIAAGSEIDLEVTATTRLLQFNRETCRLPRFEILNLFLAPETREAARRSYDEAISGGSGIYDLRRFGTGAIPFDLVLPGIGRGTLRIGNRGLVVMTHRPQFVAYKKRPNSVDELAALLEQKFGASCTLVGKAVTLIGMLALEHIFIFHESGSSYVNISRRLHQLLRERTGWQSDLHPILRARYSTWDSLKVACAWLHLPSPFHQPFATEELCAPSFANRWKEVAAEQEHLLARLAELRRPLDFIHFLQKNVGSSWQRLADEYVRLHEELAQLDGALSDVGKEIHKHYVRIRALRQERTRLELEKGHHFRSAIYEQEPSPESLAARERFDQLILAVVRERRESEADLRELRRTQGSMTKADAIQQAHKRRREIEMEMELKRLRLIRHGIGASKGLRSADHRPSAWWFPMLSPDGLWYRQTIESAHFYLEPLV